MYANLSTKNIIKFIADENKTVLYIYNLYIYIYMSHNQNDIGLFYMISCVLVLPVSLRRRA